MALSSAAMRSGGRSPRLCGAAWLALLLCLSPCVMAQSSDVRYVNDVIHINLREAPERDAATVLVIPSGTRMTVLARDDASGFSRVRLESGEEGWVQHQFLTREPIARDRLAAALSAAEQLQAERDRARAELERLSQERADLARQAQTHEQRSAALASELDEVRAASAEALELGARARQIEAGLGEARDQRDAAEARAAAAQSRLAFAAIGAVLLGLAAGFYIGSIPTRREKRWRQVD